MVQCGVVAEVSADGETVEVIFERSEACASCKACSFGRKSSITVAMPNLARAEKGDRVEVELGGGKVVKATAMAYLFPLAAFFLGLFGGQWLHGSWIPLPQDIFACITAAIAMALAFLAIRLTEKKRAKSGEFAPVMVGKISSYNNENILTKENE